jgi:hypothetical protein
MPPPMTPTETRFDLAPRTVGPVGLCHPIVCSLSPGAWWRRWHRRPSVADQAPTVAGPRHGTVTVTTAGRAKLSQQQVWTELEEDSPIPGAP